MKRILLMCIFLVGCNRSVERRLDDLEERISKIEQNQEEIDANVDYLAGRTKSINLACIDALDRTANDRQEINALAREQRQQRQDVDLIIKVLTRMRKKK